MSLVNSIKRAVELLPTSADIERGYKELPVESVSGGSQVIKVTRPEEGTRCHLFEQYRFTRDAEVFILPCLAPEFARAEFLATLTLQSRFHLTNAAAVLCIGQKALDALTARCHAALKPIWQN